MKERTEAANRGELAKTDIWMNPIHHWGADAYERIEDGSVSDSYDGGDEGIARGALMKLIKARIADGRSFAVFIITNLHPAESAEADFFNDEAIDGWVKHFRFMYMHMCHERVWKRHFKGGLEIILRQHKSKGQPKPKHTQILASTKSDDYMKQDHKYLNPRALLKTLVSDSDAQQPLTSFEFVLNPTGDVAQGALDLGPITGELFYLPENLDGRNVRDELDPSIWKPENKKQALFMCFWKGRWIPLAALGSLAFMELTKTITEKVWAGKSDEFDPRKYGQIVGFIYFGPMSAVNTTKLKFKQANLVSTRLTKDKDFRKHLSGYHIEGEDERRTGRSVDDLAEAFWKWFKNCIEEQDKKVTLLNPHFSEFTRLKYGLMTLNLGALVETTTSTKRWARGQAYGRNGSKYASAPKSFFKVVRFEHDSEKYCKDASCRNRICTCKIPNDTEEQGASKNIIVQRLPKQMYHGFWVVKPWEIKLPK